MTLFRASSVPKVVVMARGYDFRHDSEYIHSLRTKPCFHFGLQLVSDLYKTQFISVGLSRDNAYIIPRSVHTFLHPGVPSNCTHKSQHFLHYRTMSGPSNGKYIIVLAGNSAPPPFPVGADPKGPESPVIAGGRDHIVSSSLPYSANCACTMCSIS